MLNGIRLFVVSDLKYRILNFRLNCDVMKVELIIELILRCF